MTRKNICKLTLCVLFLTPFAALAAANAQTVVGTDPQPINPHVVGTDPQPINPHVVGTDPQPIIPSVITVFLSVVFG